MSVQDLLNYEALQGGKDTSGFSADANGNVIELLKYLVANLPSGSPMPPLLSPHSREALGVTMAAMSLAVPASATYPAANRAIGYPFVVTETWTAVKGWIYNGITLSGNVDIGIYSAAFARLVSIGGVAQAGTGEVQEFDITDTALDPGLYYAVVSCDNTTATMFRTNLADSRIAEGMGVFYMDTAYPLPSTITPVAAGGTLTMLPHFGFSNRTLVT